MTKRKLCPFDKVECIGEACVLYCDVNACCGLVSLTMPGPAEKQRKAEDNKAPRAREPGDARKNRYRAELFD
jgi:hypothetical protein